MNCSPRPLGQVASKHRRPVSGQRRPGGETRSPRLQGRAGAGDGKVRLPLPARQRPWPPARPRLTSGSDQGHNVLAWGQGLAAGRRPGGGAVRGRQARGERTGKGETDRVQDAEAQGGGEEKHRTGKKRPRGRRGRGETQDVKGEIEVENERPRDAEKHQ